MAMSILGVWVWGPKKAMMFEGACGTGAPFSPGSDIFRETESQRLGQSCGPSPCSGSAPGMGSALCFPGCWAGASPWCQVLQKGPRQDPLKLISALI